METTAAPPIDSPPPSPQLADHLDHHLPPVVRALVEGRLVPFFGAGVNLCGRPSDALWEESACFLPTGGELARHLAEVYEYSEEDARDLSLVSQYGAVMSGPGVLYADLRRIFDRDFAPTRVHRFFASLPRRLRGATLRHHPDPTRCGQLIITTNYDDVLERALRDERERFHVLTYIADGEHQGSFWHQPPSGPAGVIGNPDALELTELAHETVVLKIHGAVDRSDSSRDSFVVTEEHYIDYLTRTDLFSAQLPACIRTKLERSHVLFLGYSLRDWNVRAMFHRGYSRGYSRPDRVQWWAVLNRPRAIDREMWARRGISIIAEDLEAYIQALDARLQARLQPPPSPQQQRAA